MNIGEPSRIIEIEPQPHQLPGPLAQPAPEPAIKEAPAHEREPEHAEPVPA